MQNGAGCNRLGRGDAVMPKRSKRNIITNRQLNFTLSPVDLHNQKQMPHNLAHYSIDGTWNQHQSIVLDVLLDRIFKGYYQKHKNIPKSWISPIAIKVYSTFGNALFNPATLAFLNGKPIEAFSIHKGTDVKASEREKYENRLGQKDKTFEQYLETSLDQNSDYQAFLNLMHQNVAFIGRDTVFGISISKLFETYPILGQYGNKLHEHVKKISQTAFKMNYKIKCVAELPQYNSRGYRTAPGKLIDMHYQMANFESIFTVVAHDKDRFTLNFKSALGKMILVNTIILDTDWIPDEVLTLKKNAYFIYKRFVLNRVSGKNPPAQIELWFEDIKTFLDMNWANNSGIYRVINQALDEMRQKGLISDFSSNRNYVRQRQYRLMF